MKKKLTADDVREIHPVDRLRQLQREHCRSIDRQTVALLSSEPARTLSEAMKQFEKTISGGRSVCEIDIHKTHPTAARIAWRRGIRFSEIHVVDGGGNDRWLTCVAVRVDRYGQSGTARRQSGSEYYKNRKTFVLTKRTAAELFDRLLTLFGPNQWPPWSMQWADYVIQVMRENWDCPFNGESSVGPIQKIASGPGPLSRRLKKVKSK